LKAALDAKAVALATSEDQLLWERTALGHAAERAEALQASYNSSEQELQELCNASLETCRVVEEGEA
jgi:hypothetical protein